MQARLSVKGILAYQGVVVSVGNKLMDKNDSRKTFKMAKVS